MERNLMPKLAEEILKVKSINAALNAVAVAYDDLVARMDELEGRLLELETKPAKTVRLPTLWTAKAMAAALDVTGDEEKRYALKYFARSYSIEHNLSITKAEGPKSHEWFEPAAAEYAMAQVGGKK
jgi:hypothetical protein